MSDVQELRSHNRGKNSRAGCPDCAVLTSPLFRSLSEEHLKRFSCIFCATRYRRNQILFFEGGAAHHLFALNVGLVKLVKSLENGKERITRILFPGELFGLVKGQAVRFDQLSDPYYYKDRQKNLMQKWKDRRLRWENYVLGAGAQRADLRHLCAGKQRAGLC